jgi:hypothetical protein
MQLEEMTPDDLQKCQSMQQEEFEVLEVWYMHQMNDSFTNNLCIVYLSRIHFYAELGRPY